MTIPHPTLVVQFFYRGDDSRPMRVVVTADNEATVEHCQGRDALGKARWHTVDMETDDENGHPEAYPHEWAGMVACALAHYHRECLPSGDAPPQDDDSDRYHSLADAVRAAMHDFEDEYSHGPLVAAWDGMGRTSRTMASQQIASRTMGHLDPGLRVRVEAAFEGGYAPQEPGDSEPACPSCGGDRYHRTCSSCRTVYQASRPPGGAEPGLTAKVKAFIGRVTKASWDLDPAYIVDELQTILASDGAAPPSEPPVRDLDRARDLPADKLSDQEYEIASLAAEASRPPGGAEPGVCCADGCSRVGDWKTPTGRGVCSWCAAAFAQGCAALELLASEGAAPPQPTDESPATERERGTETGPWYSEREAIEAGEQLSVLRVNAGVRFEPVHNSDGWNLIRFVAEGKPTTVSADVWAEWDVRNRLAIWGILGIDPGKLDGWAYLRDELTARLASEGAAPPQSTDPIGLELGRELRRRASQTEPSGVPDAPGPWLLDGLPVAVELRGDLKWRDVHNSLWRTVQPGDAWGGRCTRGATAPDDPRPPAPEEFEARVSEAIRRTKRTTTGDASRGAALAASTTIKLVNGVPIQDHRDALARIHELEGAQVPDDGLRKRVEKLREKVYAESREAAANGYSSASKALGDVSRMIADVLEVQS